MGSEDLRRVWRRMWCRFHSRVFGVRDVRSLREVYCGRRWAVTLLMILIGLNFILIFTFLRIFLGG